MSTIRVDNWQPAAGGITLPLGQGLAQARCNLDGTGAVTVRDSFNVSAITDHGTGRYQVNLSNTFTDAKYVYAGVAGGDSTSSRHFGVASPRIMGPSYYVCDVDDSRGNPVDTDYVLSVAHGRLA